MGRIDRSSTEVSLRPQSARITFGGFRLEVDGTLYRGDAIVHLAPKELEALRLLLAHAGQIVSPAQLKQALWGDVHVTADSVPKCLSALRARLEPEDCIQTIYKRGYRLTAEVHSASAPAAKSRERLAILPFATEYSIPEHLGPAIAEETIARLSNSGDTTIEILARDSVFTLAARGLSALEIGNTLQADLVLTGTLRGLTGQFRLRVEMINVASGAQVWVEDMIVEQTRLVHLESELAQRLTYRLGSTGISLSAAAAPAPVDSPRNLEAYDLYLRGRHEWQSLERHRMQDGLHHLTRAIELDPALIPARVDLAHLSVTQALYGFMSPTNAAGIIRRAADLTAPIPTSTYTEARSASFARRSADKFPPRTPGRRAADTQPRSARFGRRSADAAFPPQRFGRRKSDLVDPHLLHGRRADDPSTATALLDPWDHSAAIAKGGFEAPLPDLHFESSAREFRQTLETHSGLFGSTSEFTDQAQALLPALGWVYFHLDHNLTAAIQAFDQCAHLSHTPWITRARSHFAISRHRFPEAISILGAALEEDPYSPWLLSRLAWAYHLSGQADQSLRCIRKAIVEFPDHEATHIYGASILAFNGDTDTAIALTQQLARRLPYLDMAQAVQAYALACAGRATEASVILDRLQWLSRERFVMNTFTPAVHVALGNHEAALAELRTSSDNHCPWFFQMLADPRLQPLHNRPEFQELKAILTRLEDDPDQSPAQS